jgi:(1->4)-alpha-D-glucan 1-alpha-D-glucosylmutase
MRIPAATYRVQFNRVFKFADAQAIVPYLQKLGISDCYASPVLKTPTDSDNGYDVCDHSQLNPVFGSEDDFAAFTSTLSKHGLGLILDIVPNHMGIGQTNAWWTHVLENGPSSSYAYYFDIEWHPVNPQLENKVLLPILEDQYGNVLEDGKLRLAYEDGAFFIYYYETKLPLTPRSYSSILEHRLERLAETLGKDNESLQELQSILTAISYLPGRTESDPEKLEERNREKEVIKRRIAALVHASPPVRDAIDTAVAEFNGTVGEPESFDLLDRLIDAQSYRLAFWRVAGEEINYRRFFDINELAAIRMELPEVFQATHQLILRFLAEGKATGLRVDHPDGLWDPAAYFSQLQQSYTSIRDATLNPKRMQAPPWPLYVVAEKILSKGESLPEDWAVYGTTGYDFLNNLNGVFVDLANRDAVDKIYCDFIGRKIDFRNLINSSKKMTMLISLASEVNSLSHQLDRISERNRHYRDFTLNTLTFAIREVIACLSVYRTYNNATTGTVSERDQKYIEAAVEEAKKRNPRTARALFDFIQDTLLLRNLQHFRAEDRPQVIEFVMELQQLTGPVMAKAVEDTAFYAFNRLTSLNEVGGDPEQFGLSVEAFHRENANRQRHWPHSMLTTSTHDTKRSEDVRARINVLSEIPAEWATALERWGRFNADKKSPVGAELAPDSNDEYLFYQTLVGAWPLEPCTIEEFGDFRERMTTYMQKAIKEAKVHTSWVNPNEVYDRAVSKFVKEVLVADPENSFVSDFKSFHRRVAYWGMLNSLSQTLLKIASPGVPDFYQGTELWDFSLVDPDNRRPVDFAKREKLLEELRQREKKDRVLLIEDLFTRWVDGRIKLYVTYKGLTFRRSQRSLFEEGNYIPVMASDGSRDRICAFARQKGPAWAVVAAPRLLTRLLRVERPPLGEEIWGSNAIVLSEDAPECWLNIFTGEELKVLLSKGRKLLPLASLFQMFPLALLTPSKSETSDH